MITITQAAAVQIRKSAEVNQAKDMYFRIVVRLEDNGSYEYGLGFDEKAPDDVHLTSEGIDILISDNCKEMLMGAVLDFVEISPGENQFIFKNPNDPKHTSKIKQDKKDDN